jgi:peroxiredoxin Q/BCP
MIPVGQPAPDFTAPTDEGTVTLSALGGQHVVLYFYPKDSTPGCTVEAQGFRDLHAQFLAKGAVVLGVSRDPVKKHRSFKAKECLPFTLVTDEATDEGGVCGLYGAWREKKLYGRAYMGIARVTYLIGPDGLVKAAWDPVKPEGHAAQVLAAIG